MSIPTLAGRSTFLIPLVNIPQKFEISLAGINYIMTCKWNPAFEAGWVFDLTEATTNISIVTNVPLITGTNCLDGLDYLGIQGEMFVYTDGDDLAVPTLANLGVNSNLYFLTSAPNG